MRQRRGREGSSTRRRTKPKKLPVKMNAGTSQGGEIQLNRNQPLNTVDILLTRALYLNNRIWFHIHLSCSHAVLTAMDYVFLVFDLMPRSSFTEKKRYTQ